MVAIRPEPLVGEPDELDAVDRVDALDVARGAGPSLVERRDVEADTHQAASQVRIEEDPARVAPREARRMRAAARGDLVTPIEGNLDCRADRRRIFGIGAHGRVAAGLVHRLVRGADDRRAAGHRLDHRQPEPLEPRGVREHGGATVEPRQLVVVDVAEPDDARPVERRLLAPPFRTDHGQQQAVATEQRMCLHERREILARLERGHREDVVAAELGIRAVAREDGVDSWQRRAARDPRARSAARRRRAP